MQAEARISALDFGGSLIQDITGDEGARTEFAQLREQLELAQEDARSWRARCVCVCVCVSLAVCALGVCLCFSLCGVWCVWGGEL